MSRHFINPWDGLRLILKVSQIIRSCAFHLSLCYPYKNDKENSQSMLNIIRLGVTAIAPYIRHIPTPPITKGCDSV